MSYSTLITADALRAQLDNPAASRKSH